MSTIYAAIEMIRFLLEFFFKFVLYDGHKVISHSLFMDLNKWYGIFDDSIEHALITKVKPQLNKFQTTVLLYKDSRLYENQSTL